MLTQGGMQDPQKNFLETRYLYIPASCFLPANNRQVMVGISLRVKVADSWFTKVKDYMIKYISTLSSLPVPSSRWLCSQ